MLTDPSLSYLLWLSLLYQFAFNTYHEIEGFQMLYRRLSKISAINSKDLKKIIFTISKYYSWNVLEQNRFAITGLHAK